MSIMTNYIINICDFLETNNINISDYDDDLTYYDGFDDVLVIYINEEKYKFIQNLYFNILIRLRVRMMTLNMSDVLPPCHVV